MIRAVIFDLDNCLAAAREVGEELYDPAFEAIRQANRGAVAPEALDKTFEDFRRHSLDWVAARYAFPPEMIAADGARLELDWKLKAYGDYQRCQPNDSS